MIALRTDNRILDTVIHGDALAVLKSMADNSVDAIVTDPPAGIAFMGKEWDNFSGKQKSYDSAGARAAANADKEKLKRIGQGTTPYGFSSSSGTPTKQERDGFIAFLSAVMTEALRVLKPGGHALVWALPRTSHWTAMALEDAGLEIRDAIFHHFGSGFPKSMDISKAIDKMTGSEREFIGYYHEPNGNERRQGESFGVSGKYRWGDEWYNLEELPPSAREYFDSGKRRRITAPATPEAQQWAGYGTALKPSTEIWWLVRKPLAEKSIAQNVLTWGTGGLNVDACRVGTEPRSTGTKNPHVPSGVHGIYGSDPRTDRQQNYDLHKPSKRFPSNLLLSHSIWCQPIGVKRVRGDKAHLSRNSGYQDSYVGGKSTVTMQSTGYTDSDGYEQVEAWDCSPYGDCPIAEMDRQSGIRKSGGGIKAKAGNPKFNGKYNNGELYANTYDNPISYEPNDGFASRYFQQFSPDIDVPWLYTSKASRRERNAGCEGLPLGEPSTYHDESIEGAASRGRQPRHSTPTANTHPTVKSLALCRWLIRLITPPGGIVLDCFLGSGSTAVAAIQEGFHFIGIEAEQEYVTIANARIEHARHNPPEQVQVATKKVKGTAPRGKPTNGKPSAQNGSTYRLPLNNGLCHSDEDGLEEVEDWDCSEDCPIRILGEQSGVRETHASGPKRARDWKEVQTNGKYEGRQGGVYGVYNKYVSTNEASTGTAARYFTQFPPDSLFAEIVPSKEES